MRGESVLSVAEALAQEPSLRAAYSLAGGCLCPYPLDRQMIPIGAFARVLEGDGAQLAAGIEVRDCILVEIL